MSDYWTRRALERMMRLELLGDDYAARLYRLYTDAFDELNKAMSDLFERYAAQGGLSPIEAVQYLREPVTRAQADALMQTISGIEDPDVKRKLLARANSAQYAARLKRLEAMQESVRAECAKVADKEIALHQEAARKIGTESYYRTVFDIQQGAGAAIPFSQISIDRIDAVLSQKWAGDDFSTRVWQNAEAMSQHLSELIRTNVATGRPWERCVEEMQQYMATPGQGSTYAAARLLRTETVHVANEMSAEASSGMGAKRYRFIAVLDLKTSEICRLHDGLKDPDTGKFYTYAARRVGVNFPPLHPWCRSIEAPYINAETLEGMTRPAKDPVTGEMMQVPATMTYSQWHKKYVEGKPDAELAERMTQNTVGDRSQWQRYREVLGKDAPKDLAAFQRMKYTDAAGWEELKSTYRDVRWMRSAQANGIEREETHTTPLQSTPDTVFDRMVDGEIVTRRYYGRTGKPRLDIDLTDHGNPTRHTMIPHHHGWEELTDGSVKRDKATDQELTLAQRIANSDILKGR